jgi:hypothetical protein
MIFSVGGGPTFHARSAGASLGNTTVMRIYRCVLTLVALFLAQIPFARAAEQVDLLLVLAMDVSRSMDQAKFELQRQGYAAAISNPQVLNAIESGPHQKIAICFIDWSAPLEQKLVIDWSIIDGAAAASRFADLIVEAPRSFYNSTSIGSPSTSQPPRSTKRHSKPNATPSMCRATAPITPVATYDSFVIGQLPKASSSTAL